MHFRLSQHVSNKIATWYSGDPSAERATPTPLEVVAYLAYLIPVLTIFVWSGRTRVTTPRPGAPATAKS